MPTYEYKCNACAYSFEIVQRMSENSLTECPQCKKQELARVIGSAGGFILKGTGYYVTDFKNPPATVPSTETKSTEPVVKTEGTKSETTSEKPSIPKEPAKTTAPTPTKSTTESK